MNALACCLVLIRAKSIDIGLDSGSYTDLDSMSLEAMGRRNVDLPRRFLHRGSYLV